MLSHNSVTVDGTEPAATDAVTTRHGFFPAVKFVSANTRKVYPGVDQTRALFLTDDYLLDVTHLDALDGKPHEYLWLAHTLGRLAKGEGKWSDPRKLDGLLAPFDTARTLETPAGAPWRLRAEQVRCVPADRAVLPQSWYDRRVGVTLSMLPAAGTTVRAADTPTADTPDKAPDPQREPQEYEAGGVSVIVARTAPRTTFAAVSVPTCRGHEKSLARFDRLSEGDDHLAVAVEVRARPDAEDAKDAKEGKGADGAKAAPAPAHTDLLLLQWGESRDPVTVEAAGGRVTFAGYCLVRLHPDRVEAWGDLRHLAVRTARPPTGLTLNGRSTRTEISDGLLTFGKPPGGP